MKFTAYPYPSVLIHLDLSMGEVNDLLYVLDTASEKLPVIEDLAVALRELTNQEAKEA